MREGGPHADPWHHASTESRLRTVEGTRRYWRPGIESTVALPDWPRLPGPPSPWSYLYALFPLPPATTVSIGGRVDFPGGTGRHPRLCFQLQPVTCANLPVFRLYEFGGMFYDKLLQSDPWFS